ncbi:MAG: hypothetical protein J0L87_08040 [Bacteroidetes bacterium]|nr:hypothetical protein [Bacteroidota bacterium]
MELRDYLNYYNIELTDDSGVEIGRYKAPVYTHTGIILGVDKYSKRERIFHNHPDNGGPTISDRWEYNNGYMSYSTGKVSQGAYAVLMRSFEQLENRKQYGLLSYNCQDATRYSREGKIGSHGIANTLGTIFALAFIATILRVKNK